MIFRAIKDLWRAWKEKKKPVWISSRGYDIFFSRDNKDFQENRSNQDVNRKKVNRKNYREMHFLQSMHNFMNEWCVRGRKIFLLINSI
jgi:hypothetical protein